MIIENTEYLVFALNDEDLLDDKNKCIMDRNVTIHHLFRDGMQEILLIFRIKSINYDSKLNYD